MELDVKFLQRRHNILVESTDNISIFCSILMQKGDDSI